MRFNTELSALRDALAESERECVEKDVLISRLEAALRAVIDEHPFALLTIKKYLNMEKVA